MVVTMLRCLRMRGRSLRMHVCRMGGSRARGCEGHHALRMLCRLGLRDWPRLLARRQWLRTFHPLRWRQGGLLTCCIPLLVVDL
ncbi:hypothetical protein XVE_4771 [Xanthomonas vesicatoria ATCC 35937]|uniref:Uncharacterized protein n=1 Tax=Xanthomonas vesicatoria ATCC 35937 TaxID=925775 RepID=F0BKF6_9XANT|nr:hypothetical protein XVE_4771 [Xanthomonas vesicatoria ATCC 35937]